MFKLLTGVSHFCFQQADDGGAAAGGDGDGDGKAAPTDNKAAPTDNKAAPDDNDGEGDSLLDGTEGDSDDSAPIDFTQGKPENFPDEAWDAEKKAPKADVLFKKLQEAETRAKGLRDKLAKGEGKAPKDPKEYTFKPDEKYAALAPEGDPVVEAARKVAHKHGMSKEQFANFMGDMTNELGTLMEGIKDQPPKELSAEEKAEVRKAEYAKIGTNAVQVIKAVESWGREMKATGILSETELQTFKDMATSGDRVRVLNKLRARQGGPELPMDFSDDGLPSDEEIATQIANVKTQEDEDKVNKLLDKRRLAGRPERLQIRA